MGERIAGKQDRFSLIIEDPLRAPKIPPKYTFNDVFHVESTSGPHVVSMLIFGSICPVFKVESA